MGILLMQGSLITTTAIMAFHFMKSLKSNGTIRDKDKVSQDENARSEIEEYTIPQSITKIANNAFLINP